MSYLALLVLKRAETAVLRSDPKSVTEEEYKAFYKTAFKDTSNSEALLYSHFKVTEGRFYRYTGAESSVVLPGRRWVN